MDVTPHFKEGRPPKAPPQRLRRVGKKAQQNIDELAEIRPLVMERSRGRCEVRWSNLCTGVGVHLHHIERRSHGGRNTVENLLHACYFCHDRIHANPLDAIARGYLKAPGA